MWQVDFTHYRLTRPDGTPGADAEILCFLDDHSRYALSVTCHQPVTGPVVVATFRQAVADQGIPASVLSDNGMVFTTRFAGGRAGRDTINGFSRRTPRPRRGAEALQAEPPHHLRQSGTVPPNPEEMAPRAAAATRKPSPNCRPSATNSSPTTTPAGRTAPWTAAPPRPPTRPGRKPPQPAQHQPSRRPASATMSSTPAANSPSATTADCTTSESDEPTPEPPS